MTRKITKILAVFGIGSITLFQAGSCDYLAEQFVKGFEIGYNGGSVEDLFGSSECDLGEDLLEVDNWDYDCDYGCELW